MRVARVENQLYLQSKGKFEVRCLRHMTVFKLNCCNPVIGIQQHKQSILQVFAVRQVKNQADAYFGVREIWILGKQC